VPFATLFSIVASKLLAVPPAGGTRAVEPELVQMEVEDIVDAVDPRLRVVSGNQRKIALGVARTSTPLQALARDLSEPIMLSCDVFWGPMAIAIMGGLTVATVLTIFLLRALYAALFRVARAVEQAPAAASASAH